ncbi:MAG TPA: pilus assembly protein N-terminal domain-containing protein [Rhizomicrobium sp.]|jgi:Flp pilus assembly secretin CpaC|nr:pilus assembly protein N-terminal domain-containing protein [Rhizomicrobium sp.]
MRRALFAAALLAAAAASGSLALAAGKGDAVALALDEVHTLTFRTPVATVYVGNPSIADVTMIDARHAFVQGKGYGRTNIMALNRDNVMVFNTHVSVTGNNSGGTVTLNRGAQRVTLNCAGGRCEQTPTPGDSKDSYDSAVGQINGHQTAARGAAVAEAKN